MGDLLALAVIAHGGMQPWDEFKTSRPSFPSPLHLERRAAVGLLTGKIFEIESCGYSGVLLLPAKHSRRLGI